MQFTKDTIIAKLTRSRQMRLDPSSTSRPDFIRATAQLHHLEGNERPYFSVTADIWHGSYKPNGWTGFRRFQQGLEADSGGCCHEDILRAWPDLQPLVDLHLADDNGVPMHAVANGWYFYSGKWHEHDRYDQAKGRSARTMAAQHLRVDEAEMPFGLDKDQFTEYVESLHDMWLEQAKAGRAMLLPAPE